jgi:hypothetical protein
MSWLSAEERCKKRCVNSMETPTRNGMAVDKKRKKATDGKALRDELLVELLAEETGRRHR